MHRITCLTDCAVALLCMLLWVPVASAKPSVAGQNPSAQARVQPGTIYICVTSPMQPTIYRSGVFKTAPNTSLAAIVDAWDTHVRQIYHLDQHAVYLNSTCVDQFYDPDGRRYIQGLEQTAKTNKSEIIVVDWKYVPGRDTPPPRAPSTDVPKLYHCYMFAAGRMYLSDNFVAPYQIDVNQVRDELRKFVKANYTPNDSADGSCAATDKSTEAKNNPQKTIVETRWKPTTLHKVVRGP